MPSLSLPRACATRAPPTAPHSNTVPHAPRRSPPCIPALPFRPLQLEQRTCSAGATGICILRSSKSFRAQKPIWLPFGVQRCGRRATDFPFGKGPGTIEREAIHAENFLKARRKGPIEAVGGDGTQWQSPVFSWQIASRALLKSFPVHEKATSLGTSPSRPNQ
jgi:hypothetical protein